MGEYKREGLSKTEENMKHGIVSERRTLENGGKHMKHGRVSESRTLENGGKHEAWESVREEDWKTEENIDQE